MKPRCTSLTANLVLWAAGLTCVQLQPALTQPRTTQPPTRPVVPTRPVILTPNRPIATQPGRHTPGALPTRVLVLRKSRVVGAKRLSQAEFKKIASAGRTMVMDEQTVAATLSKSLQAREANRIAFRRIYQSRPDLVRRWSQSEPSRPPTAPVFQFTDRRGQRQAVQLLDRDSVIRDALLADRVLKEPRQRARTYENLYNALQKRSGELPRTGEGFRKLQGLPSPAQAATRPLREINQLINEVVGIWIGLFPQPPVARVPTGRPATCAQEEGAGYGGDRTERDNAAPDTTPSPQGLLAQASWPLKYYNTCVRNQANRGTCPAFAICAAAESSIAVNHNRWVNLSEQDLYKHQKLNWFPVPPDWYGDGYNPPYSLLMQMLSIYRFPYERDWDYNPSWQRAKNDTTRKYLGSCSGYNGGACSETNHQAEEVCGEVETRVVREVVTEVCTFVDDAPVFGLLKPLGEWVCETVTQILSDVEVVQACYYETNIPGSSGFMVKGADLFYFIAPLMDPQAGVDAAKAYLTSRTPVIFCFDVPPSFQSPSSSGFVSYRASEDDAEGAHCALLTGFVDNANLPAGVSPGSGGGYFIIKNSWGTLWGDTGYGYLPYDWVKKWGLSMIAVTSVGT